MELNVLNEQGQESAKLAASDTVFGREYNEALVHQLVVAYQARVPVRSLTAATCTTRRRSPGVRRERAVPAPV